MEKEDKEPSNKKKWDNCMRYLVRSDPQAFLDWLLPGAQYQGLRPEKIKMWEIEADAVIDALYEEEELIVHVESQTYYDSTMGFRLLQYNILLVAEHEQPVRSYVIHLSNDRHMPRSPYRLKAPGPVEEREIALFFYKGVELVKMTPDDLFRQKRAVLLPLTLFTEDGTTHECVERVFQVLEREQGLTPGEQGLLKLITYMFGEFAFDHVSHAELEWFRRRFRPMLHNDFIRETPLYQEILEEGFLEGMEKGMEKGIEKGIQKGKEVGKAEERAEIVEKLRRTVMELIKKRFPQQAAMAVEDVKGVGDLDALNQLCLEVACAQQEEQLVEALKRAKQNGIQR